MIRFRAGIPTLIGRAVYLFGIFDILANVIRPFKAPAEKLTTYFPIFVNSTAFAAAVFTGVVLIILAKGLIRRKRRARDLAILLLAINIASDLFRLKYHPIQVLGSAIILTLLIIFRSEFYAISDPATKFAPIRAFVYSLVVVIFAGVFMLYFRHGHQIVGNPSPWNIVLTVLEGLVGISGPVEFTSERISNTVDVALTAFGLFILVVPLALYFKRIAPIPKVDTTEIELVKQLIKHDSDQDSLGYFATRADKSVVWADNKKAGIAYRVQAGVMLASGEPFGEFSLWPEAIDNFLTVAREHAWTPAVMGATDRGGEVWVEKAGMVAVDIGDEAIIKVNDFSLEGRPMSNVRQMVNKVKRKGYSTKTSRFGDLSMQRKQELIALAKKWRYGAAERGFSMAMDRFGTDLDSETLITTAEVDGKIHGFLYFVPWGDNRISLDRMQRDKDAEQGITELMIVETIEFAKQNGITQISLNFAAFRSLFERAEKISAGPVTRGTRNIVRFLSNWIQVESLYRFNAKFQPEWQTRYVLYPKASDLPKVAWAALRAEKLFRS